MLGIFGYTYGSLLGVFLVGMLTKKRGSNAGNILAMVCGFLVVAVLSGLHNALWVIVTGDPHAIFWKPDWLPEIAFPWRVTFGSIVTFGIAVLFRTPVEQQELAIAHVQAKA